MVMNPRMKQFIETHKMPDHTEQYAEEMLGAKPAEVLPDPDRIIPVDDEHKLIDESVKAATMITPEELVISPSKENKSMDELSPKYQLSKFADGNKQIQYVVRSNDFAELQRMVKEMESLVTPAVTVTPVAVTPVQPVSQPQTKAVDQTSEERLCPKCGSSMWDNRPKKASGVYKANASDFTCKNKACGHKIWPPKN